MRSDPVLSHQMIDAYATQNAPILSRAGYEPSAANLYLAHFAGPGGATSVLGADPNASAAAILGPRVAAANPFLRNMTAGQLIAWAGRKVGGPAPGSVLPRVAAAPASAVNPSPSAPTAAPASSQTGLGQFSPPAPGAEAPASSQDDLGQLGPEMAALASGWEQASQLQPAPQLHAMPSNAPPSLLPTQAMRLRMAMARLQGNPQGSPFPSPYAQRIADVIGNQQI